jgi:hypothetical protein
MMGSMWGSKAKRTTRSPWGWMSSPAASPAAGAGVPEVELAESSMFIFSLHI